MNEKMLTIAPAEAAQRSFIARVYGWMTAALIMTGLVAAYTITNHRLLLAIATDRTFFIGLILGELAIVLILSAMINKLSAFAATLGFLVYAVINGLTLSIVFLAYTESSIATAFFVTAGTFGIMSAYGYFTKRDLTTVGNLCLMGLFGLILASLANLFLRSGGIYWATTYLGILIFVGLTAYDTQKLKGLAAVEEQGEDVARKAAVIGALALYLDFINLFLRLLRILGRRR